MVRRVCLAVVVVVAVSGAMAACGGRRASPEEIVGQAAPKTLAARRASVAVAAPGLTGTGELRPAEGAGSMNGRAIDVAATGPFPSLIAADPYLVIDLIAGRTKVETYGGAEIRGTSTFRYDLTVSPAKALRAAPPGRAGPLRALLGQMRATTLFLDVWVDNQGRLRHIEVPVNPNDKRPGYLGGKLVDLVTVDLFAFQ